MKLVYPGEDEDLQESSFSKNRRINVLGSNDLSVFFAVVFIVTKTETRMIWAVK